MCIGIALRVEKDREMVNRERAKAILGAFEGKAILVVGDLILDKYMRGKVERISPEAPVPVVLVESEFFSPGGAANVVNNLYALGARTVVVGRVGDDAEGHVLCDLLRAEHTDVSGIMVDAGGPTCLKTRVIAHHQHVVRIDREGKAELDGPSLEQVVGVLQAVIGKVDGVVVSDYGKGFVTPCLMKEIAFLAGMNGKPLVVDPKSKDFGRYRGAKCITPNQREAGQACGVDIQGEEEVVQCGRQILRMVEADSVLITRGEYGMSLFEAEGVTHIPTVAQQVYDVSGAGDTVVACFALASACGALSREAAYLSNVAAGIVVAKLGTATATRDEIFDTLEHLE